MYSLTKDSARLAVAFNDVGSDYRDMGEYEEGYFLPDTKFIALARNHHKKARQG